MAEEKKDDDNVVKVNLQEIAEKQNQEPEVHKVDLSKPPGEQQEEEEKIIEEIAEKTEEELAAEKAAAEEAAKKGDDVIEEITDKTEEELAEEKRIADEAKAKKLLDEEIKEKEVQLPENIQKLVDFMNDTNGTVEDYVMLNKDVDTLSESQLLKEYHRNIEPDFDAEEIDLLMEDLYDSDEDMDSDKDIKRKKMAKKRDLGKAKRHLKGLKDKYYDEIKAGSKLNPEQKKAIDFFDRYNKEQSESSNTKSQTRKIFTEKSDQLFNDEFKGFEFKVGDKRYRYNVKNAGDVKETQSDINNFTKKYLGDDKTLKDAKGYHKALFTAMNADTIADHFYKQGAADALKNSAKNAKNINMDPRGTHEKVQAKAGFKVKAVDSDNSSPGKLRIRG